MSLLDVRNLSIVYEPRGAEPTTAVKDASFRLAQGEFVGLVGESGSGKSTLGFALTRLAKPPARISGGSILFDGTDIAELDTEQVRLQRHGGFAMVLQSGMNALNPVRTIGHHFGDVFAAHGHVPRARRRTRAVELLEKVELTAAVLDRYPGELSGGMRQRVSIALALSLEPRLMVFDEPTTALDVMVQHAVMRTIRELQESEGFTAVLISHDLGVVLESTARVLVMKDGVIVEDAPSREVFERPRHPYTRTLLGHYADPRAEVVELPGLPAAAPKAAGGDGPAGPDDRTGTGTGTGGGTGTGTATGDGSRTGESSDPRERARGAGSAGGHPGGRTGTRAAAQDAIVVTDVGRVYPGRRRGDAPVTAVEGVSFRLEPGASMALVGQSGSGKSTLAKLVTGVEQPTSGTVSFGDLRVDRLRRRQLHRLHADVQMVFQDPYAALNPLHTVEYTLTRPVVNFTGRKGAEARRRVLELLEIVGLTPVEQFAARLPHELSGGQRQRVVIARALASDPQVLIADEPVSMLDVSLRAGVLALLRDLRSDFGVSLLYITHDLLSARVVTDRIMVLHQGRVVESGPTAQVLRFPEHDYTTRLLDSIPQPARRFADTAGSGEGAA
ncbi:putative ABC transporter ATP-binding protein [Actinacidiphila reveromycinica]|uniref:Putative ABC transporter ATP-binding protein n=1 Tax=Actinacidiphila reveromycinica TaxID=659352 RepID=A0A7U3VP71_9ACTN|nr:ABC transporter ATP-binding protein [Streptomyces sp. SN-593]BBA98427.1 putative ABC transporter ATP-binding protein [Streptomyces sp. SN-593]